MRTINIFLLLPESNPEHDIFLSNEPYWDEERFEQFAIELNKALELAYAEKDTEIYYDSQNINRFIEAFNKLSGYYMIDPASVIGDMLSDAVIWTNHPVQKNGCRYFIWHLPTEQSYAIINHTIAEVAERILQVTEDSKRFLLLDYNALASDGPIIPVVKDATHLEELPLLVKVESAKNADGIYIWLSKNRLPRKLNDRDKKHGENGKGAHKSNKGDKVELLLCSFEEARQLLETAIGDKRKNKRRLFNFDPNPDRRKYIVFYFEGETLYNLYHAFHLQNENDVNAMIPKVVLDRLNANPLP